MPTALFVCSGGGHLKQLFELSDRLGIPVEDQLWVTFENGQSTSLLEGRRVVYTPFVAPRDFVNILRARRLAHKVLRQNPDINLVISTGSSPAVAYLPLTARRGIPSHYIESAARAAGPSLSGRILQRFPKVHTYTQYPEWANERWQFRGSIYDAYAPGPTAAGDVSLRRAVVSVGTQEGYHFDRLYRALVPLLKDVDEVLWQTGDQDVSKFGITGVPSMAHSEMSAAIAAADVVITHCGTGSALTCMNVGKHAIIVPRRKEFGEHIDDHQEQIGRELSRRGLATMRAPEDITTADLIYAAQQSIKKTVPPRFVLDGQADTK